ncbi:aldehyde dehydrogenase family protein [Vallitalea pronyensis]|uniref:Aldehyde dehydrogenase family protein n=1 Tax=Vallitalea pronyensis TaxID=1348613 RepID=A0A8J8MLF5_9FIRM|nr:aldehyde dehydrogenase family protein [Vallitalea pronyensis]QUI23686.1 aldehyde dehydrogenase family protein [Vallitalea pronyensis]
MDSSQDVVKVLMKKAREAQKSIERYTQEEIDDVCLAVGWEVYKDDNIRLLAEEAVRETGMGMVSDKIKKHKVKVMGVLKDIKGAQSVGLIEKQEKKGIYKYAKPMGVIGALTPVTNPTATPASNVLSILKGRNAVIFAPHPKAKKCSKMAIDFMRQGLKKVGAPEDLIQIIEEPTIALTTQLMQDVDLVVATGGGAMVKAAYSSGTPAYGVGPGNSVQIIAEDADIEDAVHKITISKIFDHATSCSSENAIIVHESIYNQVMDALKKNNGYLCEEDDKKRLQDWMWVPNKKGHISLNAKIVAQSAKKIAGDAGISVPQTTRMLLVEGELPIEKERFSEEKLSPVLTIWKYTAFDEGLDMLIRLTHVAGMGHSCGIHTFNEDYIQKLAIEMKSSRIMIRQPQAPANGGNFFNGMPSTTTLGCGTWGGNITTENINYKHFINVTWVSYPIKPMKPTDEEIWGEFWLKYQS